MQGWYEAIETVIKALKSANPDHNLGAVGASCFSSIFGMYTHKFVRATTHV